MRSDLLQDRTHAVPPHAQVNPREIVVHRAARKLLVATRLQLLRDPPRPTKQHISRLQDRRPLGDIGQPIELREILQQVPAQRPEARPAGSVR